MHAVKQGSLEAAGLLARREAEATGWTMLVCAHLAERGLQDERGCAGAVQSLAPHESGLFNAGDRCALVLALQKNHGECASLLMRKLPCRDAAGVPCIARLGMLCGTESADSPLVGWKSQWDYTTASTKILSPMWISLIPISLF